MDLITSLVEAARPYCHYIIGGCTVVLTGLAASRLFSFRRKYGEGSIKAPRNTPLIYQIGRGPYAPSMSPFPLKLETYCRIANIPYMVDTTGRFSSRDKIPWMTYNGEVVEDSQMCIAFLNKKMGVDINSHLTKEQRAVDKMIQVLVDEHLFWPAVLNRWVYPHKTFYTVINEKTGWNLPLFVYKMLKKIMLDAAKGQGIGRHSQEEVLEIMMEDLRCLSSYLGDKRYMFGDKMSQCDCSVFGLLCQFVFHHFESPGLKNIVEDNFPKLHQYVLRIKTEVWADWDENLTPTVYT